MQMVSSFRGLSEILQMRQGSGVVMDWRQASGTLLVGGDSRIIRSWDASVETTPVVSCLTVHVHHQCSDPSSKRIWLPSQTVLLRPLSLIMDPLSLS